MWSVASFMHKLLNETPGIDISAKSDAYARLEALSEVLLEAYIAAITARIECREEHKGLLNEYWNRRDALLDSLYKSEVLWHLITSMKAWDLKEVSDSLYLNNYKRSSSFPRF